MTPELRISRRQVLGRLGGLVAASGLLAACTPSTPVTPTSPPTSGAAATGAPAPKPTTAPAAAATPAAAQPSSKPRAIIGIIQEPTSMDPTADATASIATTLRDNLYEGLVRLDGSGKIVGSLARSEEHTSELQSPMYLV